MKISNNNDEKFILSELASRIKQYRISLNITQAELADKCGLSLKTVARIETGCDTSFSNIIKVIKGIGLSDNFDILVPEPQPDYKAMYEKTKLRRRARHTNPKSANGWVWGDDK